MEYFSKILKRGVGGPEGSNFKDNNSRQLLFMLLKTENEQLFLQPEYNFSL